eukprot:jgi/Tetstr1/435059/TSEL_024029.t1
MSTGRSICGANWNVGLALLVAAAGGLSESIWGTTVLSAFIYLTTDGSNFIVGWAEGVQGIAALVSALPVGWLGDKLPRSRITAAGGALQLAATATCALYVRHTGPLWVLLLSLLLWGVVNTCSYGPLQALYADSVPTGQRSRYYTYLYLAWLLPGAVGPGVGLLMFHFLGNSWTVDDLRPIFYFGLALEVPIAFLLFLFDDKQALGAESDHVSSSDGPGTEPLLGESPRGGEDESPPGNDGSAAAEDVASVSRHLERSRQRMASIPYLLFLADMIGSLGSGMTVKFFPLFFKNDVKMSPKAVQAVYVAVPIAIAGASLLATWVSNHAGRIQAILLAKVFGTGCLFLLVALKHTRSLPLMVGLFLVRASLQNATYPLSESILMDYVPKASRARWKSLESVVQFGWCGSAVLGGWIGDRYGYSSTFLVTAILQSVGILFYGALLGLVPSKEGHLRDSGALAEAAAEAEALPVRSPRLSFSQEPAPHLAASPPSAL